jgi:hypothetical protein
MRRFMRLAAGLLAFGGLGACVTDDTAYNFEYSPPPWACAPPRPGRSPAAQTKPCSPTDPQGGLAPAILSGDPAKLDPQQQEIVIVGVTKWLKDRSSARFGPMQVIRDPRGPLVVCGWIDGHNGAAAYRGMSPYIGVLTGSRNDAEFVVVGIGATARERAEVLSLCAEVGVTAL